MSSQRRTRSGESLLPRIFDAKLRGDTEFLIKALRDPQHRDAAAEFLGELGDRRAIRPLLPLLDASDGQVRAAAATALGRLRAVEAKDPLIAIATRDPEHYVRVWAIDALAAVGDSDAVPSLVELLEDADFHVRRSAAKALATIADERVLEHLIKARNNESWYRRGAFREAERRIRQKSLQPSPPGDE